ncbi:Sec-independent protein translocase subunit TatA/TatB [Telmatobacter bradus]|uniref:Sec-independent protein translocase subunit TatA/TatB n=1 Tax=Telmatobacter bradus TaxID=474953 RepID=UPI003B43D44D
MGTPLPIEAANIGMADSLILMIMALVVFGPRKLPQLGRQVGKLMYEFRKASNEFKFQMEEELRAAEDADRKRQQEAQQPVLSAPAAPEAATMLETPSTPADDNHENDSHGSDSYRDYLQAQLPPISVAAEPAATEAPAASAGQPAIEPATEAAIEPAAATDAVPTPEKTETAAHHA